MPDKMIKKQTPKIKGKDEAPPKEGNLIWVGIALILGTAFIIWIANYLNPSGSGMPDDMAVRKTIRDQFDAFFAKDVDKFLSFYSTDYNNGRYNYADKKSQAAQIADADFRIKDFNIEYEETGPEGTKESVYFDHDRGFASVLAYTSWRQSGGKSITFTPVEKLNAFLLRKEGKDWKIIEDTSVTLHKKEDVEPLMNTSEFKPYLDPSTMEWPPKPEKPPGPPPGQSGASAEPEGGQPETPASDEPSPDGE